MRLDVADRVGHRAHHLVHRRVPHVGSLLERLHDHDLDVRRHHPVARRLDRPLRQVLDQDLPVALADERHAPDEHLVEADPERVDVGAVIDVGATLALLGRHVRRRAEHEPGARAVRAEGALVAGQLGDAEIEELDEVLVAAARRQDDVVGLEIAVDDAGLVRRGERIRDLERDRQRPLGRQRRLGPDHLRQGDPRQVLHDEVDEPIAAARAGLDHAVVDDVDDVRVADRVDRLGLGEEPGDDVLVRRELGVKDLEGDLLADARVLRKIDGSHPALAQLLGDQIVADGLPDEAV